MIGSTDATTTGARAGPRTCARARAPCSRHSRLVPDARVVHSRLVPDARVVHAWVVHAWVGFLRIAAAGGVRGLAQGLRVLDGAVEVGLREQGGAGVGVDRGAPRRRCR